LLDADCIPECATTRHHDFAFHEYEPRRNPQGRLHSATLLRYFLRQQNLVDHVWPIINRLWDHLGRDEVVWGAKWTNSNFHSFELYFYNWKVLRRRHRRTLSSLRTVLRPWLDDISAADEGSSYEICSFDIDESFHRTHRASGAHIYIPAEDIVQHRDFFSYGIHPEGLKLENHYATFFAKGGTNKVRQRLGLSVHTRNNQARTAVLPSQLCQCFRISYVTKPTCDGLYFNRITTKQATWFAQQFLPKHVARIFETNANLFDHLFFDVAYDFSASHRRGNPVEFRKFGIYGLV
jgi:hypothetical protein